MDLLTFSVEMTKALAWPISTAVIAFAFRQQIKELLHRMKKGKVGPAEFEFEEKLREMVASNQDLVILEDQKERGIGALRIAAEPRAIVFETWIDIETELRAIAKDVGLPADERVSIMKLTEILEDHKKIDRLAAVAIQDMQKLRNSAAHGLEFSPEPEAILTYVHMGRALKALLRKARNAA